MTVGTIPASIGNFCNIKLLDVSFNGLTRSLLEFLKEIQNYNSKGVLPELRELYLYKNQVMGLYKNQVMGMQIARMVESARKNYYSRSL